MLHCALTTWTRSWTWGSLWVSSNLGYSRILWPSSVFFCCLVPVLRLDAWWVTWEFQFCLWEENQSNLQFWWFQKKNLKDISKEDTKLRRTTEYKYLFLWVLPGVWLVVLCLGGYWHWLSSHWLLQDMDSLSVKSSVMTTLAALFPHIYLIHNSMCQNLPFLNLRW